MLLPPPQIQYVLGVEKLGRLRGSITNLPLFWLSFASNRVEQPWKKHQLLIWPWTYLYNWSDWFTGDYSALYHTISPSVLHSLISQLISSFIQVLHITLYRQYSKWTIRDTLTCIFFYRTNFFLASNNVANYWLSTTQPLARLCPVSLGIDLCQVKLPESTFIYIITYDYLVNIYTYIYIYKYITKYIHLKLAQVFCDFERCCNSAFLQPGSSEKCDLLIHTNASKEDSPAPAMKSHVKNHQQVTDWAHCLSKMMDFDSWKNCDIPNMMGKS